MIFEDKSGIRWLCFVSVQIAVGLVVLAFAALFVAAILVSPPLPVPEELPTSEALAATEWKTGAELEPVPAVERDRQIAPGERFRTANMLRTAFLNQDSQASVSDFKRHADQLDAVFPNWFQWTDPREGLHREINEEVADCLRASPAAVLPLISNADANGTWHGKDVAGLLRDRAKADGLIRSLADECARRRVAGINIDFETLEKSDRKPYAGWISRLAAEFHRRGMLVTVDVPPEDEAFDYASIAASSDKVIVMTYDENFATAEPGPVASVEWVRKNIEHLVASIPPERLIVGLGAYAYDWDTTAETPARSLSYAQAIHLADSMDAGVDTDTESLNEHFEFQEPDGDQHEVWLLDAVSCWSQFQRVRDKGVGGFALWRLGLEEQGVWDFLANGAAGYDPHRLAAVPVQDSLIASGEGEIYRIKGLAENGSRELKLSGNDVTYATYTKLPRFAEIEKHGHSDQPKIALTFDDGPDPVWTPRILDLLASYQVKATFFLVGDRVLSSPGLARREFAEGHILGNHSFTHPHLDLSSPARLRLEMDMAQRSIEAVTGRTTVLFRAPFDTDTTPLDTPLLDPLRRISDHGYYIVGADVDSRDTEGQDARQIISNVLGGIRETGGNIVVFHDFGNDRSDTIEALRTLIPTLRQKGYRFVTVEDLMGCPRDAVMPYAASGEWPFLTQIGILSWLAAHVVPTVTWLLIAATCLAMARLVFLGALIVRAALRKTHESGKPSGPETFTPPVVVLVPAYNEEKVIARTIEAVLCSRYPALNLCVIDDGSTDRTAAIVAGYAVRTPRVRLISKPNGGKASALNLGFQAIACDYIVTIDGDTIILPDTISHLMEPFADDTVDAVCGNVRVGNVKSLLTRFQDVEYVTTQNYDRRAFEALNCITVVPGATGAWRRKSILAIGAYSDDTLTEDADLTIHLVANGGRIMYAPLGISVTEVPETLRDLHKQRFRWSFGMLQSIWKHRRQFGRGTLGWLAMPNIVAQILLLQLAPLCDILLLTYLFTGQYAGVVQAGITLFLLELVSSLVAFKLDNRKFSNLWVVVVQRFIYRPFLYWVAISALVAVIRGRRHGWNKLQRSGSVVQSSDQAESIPQDGTCAAPESVSP